MGRPCTSFPGAGAARPASERAGQGLSHRAPTGRRAIPTLFVGREHAPNGCDQTLEFDRFGIELVAPCSDGLIALTLHRMRGHADDWNVPGLRIVLEMPHGFPTIII